MEVSRKLAVAAATAALAATMQVQPAGAQTFNYFTTGQFTSGGATCNNPVAAMTVTCAQPVTGGLSLTFTGVPVSPFNYANGSQITLGTFTPGGTGSAATTSGQVLFTLFINQTNPTTGQTKAVGTFNGTFRRDPATGSFSSLIWTPNQVASVPPTVYTLIFDQNSNGIKIGAEYTTSVNAVGTVPEPSSMALLGTGLVGLVPLVRRRRK